MKYRIRKPEVDALRLPCDLNIDGVRHKQNSWVVAMDDRIAVFCDEEFAEQFEAVDGEAALSIAEEWDCKMAAPTPRRVPRKSKEEKTPPPAEQPAKKSLNRKILDALEKTPRTRAALGLALDGENQVSVSQALWYLKKQGQVIYDEDRELYRLPVVKVRNAG